MAETFSSIRSIATPLPLINSGDDADFDAAAQRFVQDIHALANDLNGDTIKKLNKLVPDLNKTINNLTAIQNAAANAGAAETSAEAAATSAAAAAASASAANSSKTAAASSATAANTSKTNAASSATAAANSAAAAAANAGTVSEAVEILSANTQAIENAAANAVNAAASAASAATSAAQAVAATSGKLDKSGGAMTGDVTFAAGKAVKFHSSNTGEPKVYLEGGGGVTQDSGNVMQIGTQNNNVYARTRAGGCFYVFCGGKHTATSGDPGQDGACEMAVSSGQTVIREKLIIESKPNSGSAGAAPTGWCDLRLKPTAIDGVEATEYPWIRARNSTGRTTAALTLRAGGMALIGSGESADTYYLNMVCADTTSPALPAGFGAEVGAKSMDEAAEQLFLTSDNAIYFVAKVQNWAAGKMMVYNGDALFPAVAGAVDLGTATLPIGTVYGTLQGKLATARTISLTGEATGSVAFDGSQNVSLSVAVAGSQKKYLDRYVTSTGAFGARGFGGLSCVKESTGVYVISMGMPTTALVPVATIAYIAGSQAVRAAVETPSTSENIIRVRVYDAANNPVDGAFYLKA
jgi:hypothetical protein